MSDLREALDRAVQAHAKTLAPNTEKEKDDKDADVSKRTSR